jgi:hypothetical protein
MFVLVLFARYAGSQIQGQDGITVGPIKVLVWFYTIVVVVVTSLFISSYFGHWPLDFRAAAGTASRDQQIRSLLIEYDSRIIQLESVARQIDDFQTPLDKGSGTLCIFWLVKGSKTGVCNGGNPFRSLVDIVNDLKALDVRADSTAALTTLNDMLTERGETVVATTGGDRRLYPPGLLNQRLDSLRGYSREAWSHLGRT